MGILRKGRRYERGWEERDKGRRVARGGWGWGVREEEMRQKQTKGEQ